MKKEIKINHGWVIIATFAGFVVSAIWYTIFGKIYMELRGINPTATANNDTSVWTIFIELARTLVLTYVLAYFVAALEINNWKKALQICLIIWIGFPLILLSGSVTHENVPWKLAAIHAGDWFVKPFAILLILSSRNHEKIN